MTVRRKKSSRASGARAAIARIEAELPKSLRDYARDVEARLNRLERSIEKAGASARREATRVLCEGSRQLGALEARGEAAWRRLSAPYRKDAVALLARLETAIKPASGGNLRRKVRRRKKAVS